MYSFIQRGEIARRIARASDIPTYRRLLQQAGHPAASKVDTDERRLAVTLVSVLLETMSEEELAATTARPQEATKTAFAGTVAEVKKNAGQKLKNIRASIGRIWTTLSSGRPTASTPTRSTSDDGSGTPRPGSTNRR